jgi:hypothetical protein
VLSSLKFVLSIISKFIFPIENQMGMAEKFLLVMVGVLVLACCCLAACITACCLWLKNDAHCGGGGGGGGGGEGEGCKCLGGGTDD